MYAGRIVETCSVETLFEDPSHPYTKALLNSTPTLKNIQNKLESIPGTVPISSKMPAGCPFSPRCSMAKDVCSEVTPELLSIGEHHDVSCLAYQEEYKNHWG